MAVGRIERDALYLTIRSHGALIKKNHSISQRNFLQICWMLAFWMSENVRQSMALEYQKRFVKDVCLRSIFFLKRSAFIVALFLGRLSPRCGGLAVGPAAVSGVGASARPCSRGASVPSGSMGPAVWGAGGPSDGQAGAGEYAQGGQVVLR